MKQQAPVYIAIDKYGDKFYYGDKEMTILHRVDGPAVEWSNGTKQWWQNGQRHRTDGPAVEWSDGDKFWYQNGQRHRVDGPAIEWSNGTKSWWQNDRRHRTDGPAVEYAAGTKFWYIDGVRMSEAEFLAATAPKIVHELTLDDIAARLGLPVESLKIVKER